MLINDLDLLEYIRHRNGDQLIQGPGSRLVQKALELNVPAPDFKNTYGHSVFPGYVGFLDLEGFSKHTHEKSPLEIAAYLRPFLDGVIGILRSRSILVDKTIGDEIMFVLPEVQEDPRWPGLLLLGQAMGRIHDFAFNNNGAYRFRIGLAYGPLSFFKIGGSGYSEWTAVGEVVHVAKRLHELPQLRCPQPVVGAFGMTVTRESEDEVTAVMKQRLSFIAGDASRFRSTFLPSWVELKGVGDVKCSLLEPRPERVVKACVEGS